MNLCCFVLPQTPAAPRVPSFSEDSAASAKEDEEGSSDGADKPSHPDASQKGKLGDGKNTKVENLFSMCPPFIPASNSSAVQSPGPSLFTSCLAGSSHSG